MIDDVDYASGVDCQALIDSWDDSTATIKGYLFIAKETDAAVWRIFALTSLTSQSGYTQLNVTPILSNGSLSNNDPVTIDFSRTGDNGSAGAQGAQGAQGTQGTSGLADPRLTVEASNTSVTVNSDNIDIHIQTALAGNPTYNAPTGTPVNGRRLLFRIKTTGTRTVTWNAIFRNGLATMPGTCYSTYTYYVGFMYNAEGTKWDCVVSGTGTF
jgi:hypothetical protein